MVSGVSRSSARIISLTYRDVHWFNTVKIPRQALETSLGPGKVDQRARNMFVLGASLAALFDIQQISDFLKAALKMLDEWESWTEGSSKGVKGIFQGKKDRKRSTGGPSESVMHDNESYLLMVNLVSPMTLWKL